MHPILFEISWLWGLKIHSYGVLVALGAAVGILWVKREASRLGQDPAKALDLVFYAIIGAFVGARLFHTFVTERARLFSDPFLLFRIWEGGLVFYGAVIGGLAVCIWLIRRWRLPTFVYLDILAPAISLAHAFGRIGCFFAGCCYGRPTPGHPWYAVVFPDGGQSFAPGDIPLYPTQLGEALGEFLIFGLLMVVRSRRHVTGQVFATYLMAYSVLRSVMELFRGDAERGFVIEGWLSTSQFVSVLIFIVGLMLMLRGRHRHQEASR